MWADIQFSLLKTNSSTEHTIIHVVTHMNSNATKVNMKHLTLSDLRIHPVPRNQFDVIQKSNYALLHPI